MYVVALLQQTTRTLDHDQYIPAGPEFLRMEFAIKNKGLSLFVPFKTVKLHFKDSTWTSTAGWLLSCLRIS